VRLAYNVDNRTLIPRPPLTEPELVESIPVPTRGIPGVPDLMHHKYVIRDKSAVWSGSTNWTADSWTREENVILTAESPELAGIFTQNFDRLWETSDVSSTGKQPTAPIAVGGIQVRPWFCPGRGDKLAHRIAKAIGSAQRRVRIASPVITSGPILGTLAEVVSDDRIDVAGVIDATQIAEVIHQWRTNGKSGWKEPLLRTALGRAPFTGKRSTPYAPGSVHDYMHAKVTICDDVVFVGSFNLSHSGEQNAENVLEISDPSLAGRLATFVDEIRGRYPVVELPS
jgi:phosphatidylserine/phosphatidylglycerophosphate/cardiolipin synthase-like enzyme